MSLPKMILFLINLFASTSLAFAQVNDVYQNNEQKNSSPLTIENANIEQLYDHLSIAEQAKDSITVFHYLCEISRYYNTIGQWKRAVGLLPEITELAYEMESDSLILKALSLTAFGIRGQVVQQFKYEEITKSEFLVIADSVVQLYNKVIELSKPQNEKLLMGAYQGIGQMYLKTSPVRFADIDKAIYHFSVSLEYAKKLNDIERVFTMNRHLAHSYLEKNDYSKSVELFTKIAPMAESLNTLSHSTRGLFYDKFLVAQMMLAGRDDIVDLHNRSLDERRKKWRLSRLDAVAGMDRQYETTKTKNELAQQEKINQLQQAQIDQRNLILGILVLLFLSAGGGGVFFFRLNRKNQQLAENNALLVKEQNHRVKNNLQMISSLLSLQANRTEGASKEHILDGSRRVQAIGLLHRKLYDDLNGLKEVNLRSYIEELVEDILYATSQPNIPVKLDLENVSIPVEKAIHLALILNELITNSIKHVFSKATLNGESINISLTKHVNELKLVYKDLGRTFNLQAFKNSDSLGNQIIQSQSNYLSKNWKVQDDHGFNYLIRLKLS